VLHSDLRLRPTKVTGVLESLKNDEVWRLGQTKSLTPNRMFEHCHFYSFLTSGSCLWPVIGIRWVALWPRRLFVKMFNWLLTNVIPICYWLLFQNRCRKFPRKFTLCICWHFFFSWMIKTLCFFVLQCFLHQWIHFICLYTPKINTAVTSDQ